MRTRSCKRAKGEWLLSEVAPFIRRILRRSATDADRTVVALELADWLDAHGDKLGNAKWLRHPKLRWEHHDYGISWDVHPWDNNGHGCGARIDYFWWTAYYPTRGWIESKDAEELLRAWVRNGVEFEEYSWTQEVAIRIGLSKTYQRLVNDRIERREAYRKRQIEKETHDRKTYAELQRAFGTASFCDGGGI